MLVDCRCVRCHRSLRVLELNRSKSLHCPSCAAAVVVPSCTAVEAQPTMKAEPACTAKAMPAGALPSRLLLPWLLLAPTVPALALWSGAGYGVLWAGLGVGLGGLCLLLGQRGRWPMSLRIGVSLSPALLGHGLALASPLDGMPSRLDAKSLPTNAFALLSVSDPRYAADKTQTANVFSSDELEDLMLRGLRRETTNRSSPLDLQPTADIGDLLAATAAVEPNGTGAAVVATKDGTIKDFVYPDFRLRAAHRLDGAAYRLVLDGRRGVLWAAVCEADKLRGDRHGDRPRGRADLHVYDLPPSARGLLHPRRILPLGGDVLELLISADQTALFYLAHTNDGVRLGRIDAARQALDRQIVLPDETRALCLTADGQTLYAAGGGSVHILDAATLRTRQRLDVKMNAYAIAADNEGCVYLAERGQWTNLTCLDLRGSQPAIRQWNARLHGRIYLKMSPDQYRLYVGTSSVISDHLDSLLIRGHPWSTPPLLAMTLSTPQSPVQGEFFLTPDGRFLINRWGRVFHLSRGVAKVPFASRAASPGPARLAGPTGAP